MPLSSPSHQDPVQRPHMMPHSFQRHISHVCTAQRAVLAHSTGAAASADKKPPRAKGKLRIDKMFLDTHNEMVARDLPILHARTLLSNTYYVRNPEDVWAMITKDDITFAKSGRVAATKEWLGSGIFSQLNPDKHAAARAVLNPSFRRDYLCKLDTFMVASALALTHILTAAAAAAGSTGAVTRAGAAVGDAATGGAPAAGAVDMQRLFRLCTLDTIGLTSLNKSFDALKLWSKQQQQPAQSSSSSSGGQLQLEQLLWDLESAFLWQSLQLPVPRSWLPGWSKYIAACEQLDSVINSILDETRTQQQQPQPTGNGPASTAPSDGIPLSSSSSSSRQTLMSFLLAAQQAQGHDAVSDQQIRDEIKTVMFAGTDTSAFTLAMCAYYLAQHPASAERAAAEVRGVLQQTGRTCVSQLRADDTSKLPWVMACVNETMRLAPAAPVITRTAVQESALAGYPIPKGMSVCANIYAMHRHPDIWPQPDSWLPQRWIPTEAAAEGLTTHTLPSDTPADTPGSSSSSSSKAQPFLPFSTGPRGCIGRNYALLQMVLTLAVVLGSGVRFAPAAGAQQLQQDGQQQQQQGQQQQGQQQGAEFVKGMTMHVDGGIWLAPCLAQDRGHALLGGSMH